jgi:predicted lipoprotein with Yx(FWY)xxD motif
MPERRRFAGGLLLLGLGASLAASVVAATTTTAPITPSGVQVNVRGDGWAFADARGMTLYSFDRDEGTPGESSCIDDCALAWPPFLAAAGASPVGEWTLITRADLSLQWAFRGRPLYRYSRDDVSGAAFGDGTDGQWRVAFKPMATPREIGLGRTILGSVLTDIRGLTLYSSKVECDARCQKTWEPIAAPALANAFGDWTIVTLESGFRQWAYRGQPLFHRPAADIKPGEMSGHEQPGWAVLVLEPAPPLPSWATIQPPGPARPKIASMRNGRHCWLRRMRNPSVTGRWSCIPMARGSGRTKVSACS